jgi:hypothetical protein
MDALAGRGNLPHPPTRAVETGISIGSGLSFERC